MQPPCGPFGLGINHIIKGIGGAEYIASILIGYTGEKKEQSGITLYENKAADMHADFIAAAPRAAALVVRLLMDRLIYTVARFGDDRSKTLQLHYFSLICKS